MYIGIGNTTANTMTWYPTIPIHMGKPAAGVSRFQVVKMPGGTAGTFAVLASDVTGKLWSTVLVGNTPTPWVQNTGAPVGTGTSYMAAVYGGKGVAHFFTADSLGNGVSETNVCAPNMCGNPSGFGFANNPVGCPPADVVPATGKCSLQAIAAASSSAGWIAAFAAGPGQSDIYERVSNTDGAVSGAQSAFVAPWSLVAPLRQDSSAASVTFAPSATSLRSTTMSVFAIGWDASTNITSIRATLFDPGRIFG